MEIISYSWHKGRKRVLFMDFPFLSRVETETASCSNLPTKDCSCGNLTYGCAAFHCKSPKAWVKKTQFVLTTFSLPLSFTYVCFSLPVILLALIILVIFHSKVYNSSNSYNLYIVMLNVSYSQYFCLLSNLLQLPVTFAFFTFSRKVYT